MRYTYTAVITPGEGKYYVKVPDIPGCITTGKSLEDAIVQITDALGGCLTVYEDEGTAIAPASPQSAISHDKSDILTLISVDTLSYRARTDTRAVRKNVSIPAWMAAMAEKRGINCSKVLQEALTQYLA